MPLPAMRPPAMPERRFNRVRAACIALALVAGLACLPAPAAAATVSLAELMQSLAQIKGGRANFTEQKFIALLDAPVESSGELVFAAPDRLEKRTLKPRPEAILLRGNELTVERGGRRRVLQLSDYPEIGAFVESMRGTLTGDRQSLERLYAVELDGSLERWTLSLKPRQARMAELVARIRISGSQAVVRNIEFEQRDGDRSVMTITQVTQP